MKKLLFAAVAAILFFASCTDNGEQNQPTTVTPTRDFVASFAEPGTSPDGKDAVWSKDDCLSVFTKTSHNRKYTVKETSDGGSTATFNYDSYTGSNFTTIKSNFALYPYDADAALSVYHQHNSCIKADLQELNRS